jgi:hypothetical protein
MDGLFLKAERPVTVKMNAAEKREDKILKNR